MKRLFVLRHAKAGPHDEKHDKERALIDRGRSDSALMGRMMHKRNYLPELVLCSSARRTMETWEYAAPMIGARPVTRFLDSLYDATAGTILKCIGAESGNARAVVVIGHNPGLEDFARKLVRKPANADERSRAASLATKFPTCTLVVFDFGIDEWRKIAPGTGALTDFVTPGELKAN
jgi:phosphohistidine phosphatase